MALGPSKLARTWEGALPARGLYHPSREHDACGIGLYASINNLASHAIIEAGLTILKNLEHRGAVGADPKAGDGSGIMVQLPHQFFAAEAERLKFKLPAAGEYAVGYLFMPREALPRQEIERLWRETAIEEGLRVIGWRDVPVEDRVMGLTVRKTEPWHRQLFILPGPNNRYERHFERKLFVCRKVVPNRVIEVLGSAAQAYYPDSVSTRTIVYKGLVLGKDLGAYYCDLSNKGF